MENLRLKADEKLEDLISGKYYKQTEIALKLGVSYMTLFNRRRQKNWTGKEINIILNDL